MPATAKHFWTSPQTAFGENQIQTKEVILPKSRTLLRGTITQYVQGVWVLNKKIFALIVVLVLLSNLALAKTLTVWITGHSNEELNIMKEMIDEQFSPKFGVEVAVTGLSWADNESKYLLAAASGDVPDVGSAGGLFLPELGLRGALVNLTDFPDFEEVRKRAPEGFYRSLTYDSLVFGVPYFSSLTVAYYRDDILQNLGLGPIETWDDLRRALPKMQANNTNFSLSWGLTNTVYSDINLFMWQNGGDDYTPDLQRSGLDMPGSIKGFTEFVELYTVYKIPMETPLFQGFINGDLAIMLSGQAMYANLMNGAPQLQGKWSLREVIGTMQDGEINRAATGTGWSMGIFKESKNKELAWEFIKWFTSEEVQLEMTKRITERITGSMFLPANLASLQHIPVADADRQTFLRQLEVSKASVFGLVSPNNRRRYLQFAAQEAVLTGIDPKDAMTKYAAEHNAEIARKQAEYKRFIERLLGR
jgi:ABC-type glycerol-3-phosphate transport system substrate-binding protein